MKAVARRSRSLWLVCLALLWATAACRLYEKPLASDLASVKAPGQNAPASSSQAYCAKQPEEAVCCEALTPVCNECRDANRRAQDDWRKSCLTNVAKDPCTKDPPIIACCGEATEVCAQCREAAFDKLMRWKDECAAIEAIRCDRPPEASRCESDAIPSAESCLARNRRVLAEWERRCRS